MADKSAPAGTRGPYEALRVPKKAVRTLVWALLLCSVIIVALMFLRTGETPRHALTRKELYLILSWVLAVAAYACHALWKHIQEQDTQEQYRSILGCTLDSIDVGVAVINPDMQVLSLNERMKRRHPHIDMSRKAVCFQVFNDPPTDVPCSDCPVCLTLKDGQAHEAVREVGHGYIRRSVRLVSSPIKDEQGRLAAVAEVVEDVTERRRAEETLRENDRNYRNLLEKANDGVTIVQDEEIKYVNPSLARMVGHEPGSLIGIPHTRWLAPEEVGSVSERYRRRLAGEDLPPVVRTTLMHKNGSKVRVEFDSSLITYQGRPALMVIVRDLGERKQS